ncbi:glutamate racemase [Verticiella sediminum]
MLRDIRRALPAEDLIYVADTAYVPYGEKSRHTIVARAYALADFFLAQGVKAIAVPCNTATAAAIGALRERHPDLPIVGIEPAVKPAARLTRSGVIGVFATTGTLASQKFRTLVQREAPGHRIALKPCPGWVLAVEAGQTEGAAARELVRPAVREVLDAGADVLVLGCTHFPFLAEAVRAEAGDTIPVLDTGAAVARQLGRVLDRHALLRGTGAGRTAFHASGDTEAFAAVAARLWGEPLRVAPMPARYT